MSDFDLDGDESWLLPHIILAAVIRFSLLFYGLLHDQVFNVKYTDVDYNVFTDGARFVTEGRSPFLRDGYRYTPFLAFAMTPNVWLTKVFGKLIFVLFDLMTGYLIYKILGRLPRLVPQNAAVSSSLLWFYNPLPLVVSTRGSSDSIQTFLVLLVFYFLSGKRNFLAGVIFGISIHVKMYPVIYVLGIYFLLRKHHDAQEGSQVNSLRERASSASSSLIVLNDKWSLWSPFSRERITFFLAMVMSFTLTTGLAYKWYGNRYLNEAWFYHFQRKDAQHNFSVYFYLYHLGLPVVVESFISSIAFIPQVIVILISVKKYLLSNTSNESSSTSSSSESLSVCLTEDEERTFAKFFFASFCQTFMFVHLNKVITSQYFLWYLCLFPLVFPFLQTIRGKQHLVILFYWLTGQGVWLLTAYLFEFQRITAVLPFVWISSVLFLGINIWIMYRYEVNFNIAVKHHEE